MSIDINTKLSRAKAALVIENPFVASIVCGMPLEVDDTINPPTLCTNGEFIKAHPAWIEAHTPNELKWALGHETMHCVFRHFLAKNRGERNWQKWNIAADVVINALLETDRVGDRPKGVIWEPELYAKGKTTEGVYALLPDPPADGGSGGAWDVMEAYDGDASQQTEMDAKWQVKVSQAAAAAKMCGKLSESMKRFVDDVLTPHVNWTDQLRMFFTKRARIEQSFARPNRRFLSQGLYMPGKSGNTLGDILIGYDLSGSTTAAEHSRFTAELRAIKEDCNPTGIHVIYFAGDVTGYEFFGRDDELFLNPVGHGGTAFSPIFRYAEGLGVEIDAAVILTDLYCGDFGPPPPYPVMWASTGADKAPWGEVILLRRVQHV